MTRVAWLGLVAACATSPPQKLHQPRPIAHEAVVETDEPVAHMASVDPHDPVSIPPLTPRPNLDFSRYVPDFHDEVRWPLTPMSHPVLEPKFDIAQVFAQPGVGWVDLCGRGVQNRYGGDKELLSYLRGWCNAINREPDAACSNLVPLLGSTVPRLSTAVRADLANILADSGHAESAEHLINAHNIRDIETLDLLAANYVEVGTKEDAVAINRAAIDSDDRATAATQCMRWTRAIILLDARQSPLLENIEKYATSKTPDPTCIRLHHKLTCWATHDCSGFVSDESGDARTGLLMDAYIRWNGAHSSNDWWAVADAALLAAPLEGAAELAVGAMENAIRATGGCNLGSKVFMAQYESRLLPIIGDELKARLVALATRCTGN